MQKTTGSRWAIAGALVCLAACNTPPLHDPARPPSEAELADHCTAQSGFDLGQRGAQFQRGCPKQSEADFRDGYATGHALYVAEQDIDRLEQALGQRTQRLQEMQHDTRYTVAALTAPDTATSNRLFLLERTKALSEEQGRLQKDIDRLSAEITAKRARIATLRQTLAFSE